MFMFIELKMLADIETSFYRITLQNKNVKHFKVNIKLYYKIPLRRVKKKRVLQSTKKTTSKIVC